jgi:hypothetical protein
MVRSFKEESMTQTWKVGVVALAAVFVLTAGLSAQDKWVRGEVTAMGADTLTVKVMDRSFAFKVEKATRLVARGAGTASREAQEAGKSGPALGDFVKVGQRVEVQYKETGGTMVATEIRPVAGGEGMSPDTSGASYRGTVSMVEAASIAVKGVNGQEWKFAIDAKISVIGTGVGTKARAMRDAGKPLAVPELVAAGDTVIVYYAESAGSKLAKEIRVLQRAR